MINNKNSEIDYQEFFYSSLFQSLFSVYHYLVFLQSMEHDYQPESSSAGFKVN